MFRRRVSQSQEDTPPAPPTNQEDTASAPGDGSAPISIAALRSQSRRRTSDAGGQPLPQSPASKPLEVPAGGRIRVASSGGAPPPPAAAAPGPPGVAPIRTRGAVPVPSAPAAVDEAPAAPAQQQQQPHQGVQQQVPIPPGAPQGASPAGFTSYSNPLSNDQAAAVAAAGSAKDAATKAPDAGHPAPPAAQQQQQPAGVHPHRSPAPTTTTAIPKSPLKYPDATSWHFEVTAADDIPAAGAGAAADQSRVPQYVYNHETGLLERMGEGAGTDCTAQHYLQDWRTGAFLQLQGQGSSGGGCMGWFRRWRRSRWPGAHAGAGASGEPAADVDDWLRSLSNVTDSMGHWMALLGLAAQGLCGGLSCMALFMSYLLTNGRGSQAFLAYYSPLAQSLNRTYFTLISLSIVAVVARLGYDANARFKPSTLRLRLVTAIVLLLYGVAYICNVILTPLDDRFTYEYDRVADFWSQPLPQGFLHQVAMWHSLNLVRVVCCGLAWVFVCYRASPHVVLAIVSMQQQQQQQQQALGGQVSVTAGLGAGLLGSEASFGAYGGLATATAGSAGASGGAGASTGYAGMGSVGTLRLPGSLISGDVLGTPRGTRDAVPPLTSTHGWR